MAKRKRPPGKPPKPGQTPPTHLPGGAIPKPKPKPKPRRKKY